MKNMNSLFSFFVFIVTITNIYCSIAQCDDNANCNNGHCVNQTCVCDSGYKTLTDKLCGYKQREKVTAFLISIFVGVTGADWFYLARGNIAYIVAGVFKLITMVWLWSMVYG